MKRLLITGGTGFFGKSILDYMRRHPDFLSSTEITVLSRDPRAFLSGHQSLAEQRRVHFIKGNILSNSLQQTLTQGAKQPYDAIIHAAATPSNSLSDQDMLDTIINGTHNVLKFAESSNIGRLLYISSGAVYGPLTTKVDERAPTLPTTAYGKGKLAAEDLCINSSIPCLIARCFAFTGVYLNRHIHYAIGNFIQDCLDGKDIVIKGDGTPLRSYMYADDLVEWLFTILDRGQPLRPYNVGSPFGLSIKDLAESVRRTLGVRNRIKICQRPTGDAPSVYVPDIERAKTELDLDIRTDLTSAILKSAI